MEHEGKLFADFQQYYGLNLDALLDAGEYKRAYTLAVNLPQSSRVFAALDPRAGWDVQAYLLATICDHLSFLRYELAGGKGKKPKPLERPKAIPKKTKHKRLNMSEAKKQSLLFGVRKQGR